MPTFRYSVEVKGTQVFEFEANNEAHALRIVGDLNLMSNGEDPINPSSMYLEPTQVDETVEEVDGSFVFLGE